MASSRWHGKRQKVFNSVFDTDVSQPTPSSTPSLRSTEQGHVFEDPTVSLKSHHFPGFESSTKPAAGAQSPDVTHQARWDRAWHTVTARVLLPASVSAEDSFGPLAPESQDYDHDFYDSLRVVLDPAQNTPHAAHTEDVLSWHTQQVRRHFVQHVIPLLSACLGTGTQTEVVESSIRTLEAAHRQYLWGLQLVLRGLDERQGRIVVENFRRDLHAVISNSVSPALMTALRSLLNQLMRVLLDLQPNQHRVPTAQKEAQVTQSRGDLKQLVERLQQVGLAGEKFQILCAEMMDAFMVEYIKSTYSEGWAPSKRRSTSKDGPTSLRRAAKAGTQSERIASLCDWVENYYARLAVEVFSRLDGAVIPWKDVEKWKEIAVGRLAVLRIHELFDIVLQWPHSKAALDDLRMVVTTPQRRLQLTDTFSVELQKRYLHPGRSTLDILQLYISMIRTFHALDHSKVLLDRVVHSLQLYLCQRDDAIRMVVTGLLANADEIRTEAGRGKLVELAVLLNDPSQQRRSAAEDDELDWNDMQWIPDPVDAGVNYKRPKSEDVIGTLINALGSQDIFIKEFQNIIAERLLSEQKNDFAQEVKVLNLLKKKFGEHALQNCDVMMKDIKDSKKVDALISRNIKTASRSGGAGKPPLSYHTKILSRLFWPTLDREHFLLPQPVVDVQSRYGGEFEHLKSSRKLTWLNNLGTATVHLELQDRTINVECKTYEAAVIYAFHDESNSTSDAATPSPPARRTVDELYMMLQMDDDTIRLALASWASQRVLCEVAPDTYAVLERLEDDGKDEFAAATSIAAAEGRGAPRGTASPTKAAGGGGLDAQERERRQVYWQFIVGMLTNSAPAMPLLQMSMMMKMLIVDGFSWSNEELQEFLGEKIAEGELELAGGKYRLPKK